MTIPILIRFAGAFGLGWGTLRTLRSLGTLEALGTLRAFETLLWGFVGFYGGQGR